VSADHDELRRLLGGYLLGGLDDADIDRLDSHLRDCDSCRAELDELAGVPEILQRLPDAQRASRPEAQAAVSLSTRPSPENIEGLLGKMRAQRAKESRTTRVRWLAAAAVILIAVAVGVGVVRGSRNTTTPTALPSQELVTAQFEAATGSGLSGQAVLTPKQWGVSVALDVTKLYGEGPFRCEVHNKEGGVEQAAAWGPTTTGNAKVVGASSTQIGDVTQVTVADHNGNVLGTAKVD
jgi:predicted anti-sigma-YlaC factor YlaD